MDSPKKIIISIIVTERCNLKCTYCYESNKANRSIPISRMKEILSEYLDNPDYDEVEIDFFGGEPFLEFKKIKEICEWTWSKSWKNRYIFFATTNGVLVHGEIQQWLRTHKSRFWVSVSLDGTRESHNRNRCGSYDDIDWAFFLECWPTQSVKMTISRETLPTLFEDITHLHSLGFVLAGTNFAEGLNWEDGYYKKQLSFQLEKLCQFYIEHPEITPAPLLNIPLFRCSKEEKAIVKNCGCGDRMATFGVDGSKYPCTFFTPMTFSEDVLESLNGLDWSDPNEFVDLECLEKCFLHPICPSCYGANLLVNGKINVRDKGKCELTKIRAVYAAGLAAHKLLQNPIDNFENYRTLQAIEEIYRLYSKP